MTETTHARRFTLALWRADRDLAYWRGGAYGGILVMAMGIGLTLFDSPLLAAIAWFVAVALHEVGNRAFDRYRRKQMAEIEASNQEGFLAMVGLALARVDPPLSPEQAHSFGRELRALTAARSAIERADRDEHAPHLDS